jgi:hypothetical protein
MYETDEQQEIVERRKINFEQCPKYERHELSEDQIVAIAKKAVQLAKEESDMEVGRLTKKGLRYIAGTLLIGLYVWAVQQGLIEVKK